MKLSTFPSVDSFKNMPELGAVGGFISDAVNIISLAA